MSQIDSTKSTPPPDADVQRTGDLPSTQPETTVAPQGEGLPQAQTEPQTVGVDSRMRAMHTAIRRSGGILLLDQFCVDSGKLAGKTVSPEADQAKAKVLEQVEQVRKALDQLDSLAPATLKKIDLDEPTSRIVETVFTQLDALDESLAAFEKAAGASTTSRNLRDACMARLCELSRFVGALQAEAMTEEERLEKGIHGFEPLKSGGGSIRDMLGDLALAMHGNDPATRDVSAEAESLFNELETFKARLKELPPDEATAAVLKLRGRAVALGEKVDEILAPPAKGQSKSIPGEPALFRAIGDYAKTAVIDMDGLLRQTSRDAVTPLLREAFPEVDTALLERCRKLPKPLRRTFASLQKEINGRHTGLSKKCKTGKLTGAELLSASKACDRAMSGTDARLARAALFVIHSSIHGAAYAYEEQIEIVLFQQMLRPDTFDSAQRTACRRLAQQTAGPLLAACELLRKAPPKDQEPYLLLHEAFMTENLLLRGPEVGRNVLEIADAVDRSKKPIPVAHYFPLLFEQRAKLSTLITAAMYDIPPEHLEVRPDSGTELETKILGQGAVNTVRLCRYTDDHGRPFNLVFKPEAPARNGLGNLLLFTLGYTESIRTANLNVASGVVAKLLGTPQVITTSSLGFYKGTLGLFMGHAPGKTPKDLLELRKIGDIVTELKKNGKLETMLANLQRELCRLEWADLLSGQADRHYENYLVDIDPKDGSVTVTGIDNDGSFSERMVGITTVDMTEILSLEELSGIRRACSQGKDGKHPPYELREGRVLVHFEEVTTPGGYDRIRNKIGMNQMFLPTHIDKTTYDHLMALDVGSYRESLRPFLSPQALEAAVSRLESAKKHAQALMAKAGGCLEGDDWRLPSLLTEARAALDSPRHKDGGIVGLEFFARDFAVLIP